MFVLDDDSGVHRVKLIDLNSFEHKGHRDEGLVTGVSNLIELLDFSKLVCN